MGMAASQARLLCITARISDVEFQAQSIQHAKLQLATQSDQAYKEYIEALDAQSLVLRAIDGNSGEQSTVTATFNNLCSRYRLNPAANNGYEYALKDARGRLIVEDEVAAGYQDFVQKCDYKNAEAFALYMIYGKDVTKKSEDAEKAAWEKISTDESKSIPTDLANIRESIVGLFNSEDFEEGKVDIYDTSKLDPEKIAQYNDSMRKYRELLYKYNGADVVAEYKMQGAPAGSAPITADPEEFNKNHGMFSYFVSIYNQIEANGGAIIAISKFDGFDGMAANDPEWLTSMVQCGLITIDMVKEDDKGNTVFNGTSPSSDTSLKYADTTSVDTTAAKKAEAKYENTLKQIQVKDKRFDLSLSKLDAEREALTKQRDSLKTVIKENIEKSFGIFS